MKEMHDLRPLRAWAPSLDEVLAVARKQVEIFPYVVSLTITPAFEGNSDRMHKTQYPDGGGYFVDLNICETCTESDVEPTFWH